MGERWGVLCVCLGSACDVGVAVCSATSFDLTSVPLSTPHLYIYIFREHVVLEHAREVARRGCVICTQGEAEAHRGQRRPST